MLDALQAYAHEEVATQSRGATEVSNGQNYNLISRMQTLRSSGAGSSSLAVNLPGFESLAGKPANTITGGNAGDDFASRLGFFANALVGTGDKDASTNEEAFDFDSIGITAGVDYRFGDTFVAGLAIGYSELDTEGDANSSELNSDALSLSLFAMVNSDAFMLMVH